MFVDEKMEKKMVASSSLFQGVPEICCYFKTCEEDAVYVTLLLGTWFKVNYRHGRGCLA